MGSKTFDGVWFISYAQDHPPPHVHGQYGETIVVIECRRTEPSARQGETTPSLLRMRSEVTFGGY